MQTLAAAAAAAAALGALCLALRHKHKPGGKDPSEVKARRRKQSSSSSTAAATSKASSNSAAADPRGIPQQELKRLQAFLRKVYAWRGWQGGHYHITQAWHAVEAAATTAAGGGWQQQFTGSQLTDANCDALLRLIDKQFCAGKLLKRLRAAARSGSSTPSISSTNSTSSTRSCPPRSSQGSSDSAASTCCPPVPAASVPAIGSLNTAAAAAAEAVDCPAPNGRSPMQEENSTAQPAAAAAASAPHGLCCRVVQSWHEAWLAYFDTQDDVIYINCWRWAKDVSPEAPLNCEGVVCTNRLQLLMHTLAHELVHAVVFHLFPDIDSSSQAYTANSRHGPIFQLLNKQLFGHSSDALEQVHLLPCRK